MVSRNVTKDNGAVVERSDMNGTKPSATGVRTGFRLVLSSVSAYIGLMTVASHDLMTEVTESGSDLEEAACQKLSSVSLGIAQALGRNILSAVARTKHQRSRHRTEPHLRSHGSKIPR